MNTRKGGNNSPYIRPGSPLSQVIVYPAIRDKKRWFGRKSEVAKKVLALQNFQVAHTSITKNASIQDPMHLLRPSYTATRR